MTKPKTRPKAATHSTARKTAKPAPRKHRVPASPRSAARPDTKHARIIAMLRTAAGATIVGGDIDEAEYQAKRRAQA